jgi:hypothetical protein
MLLYILVGFIVAIALLHIAAVLLPGRTSNANLLSLAPWFDLDNEFNFPTVYTGLLLGSCAFMGCILALLAHHLQNSLRWACISLVFFYLALDELLVIHERLALPIRNALLIAPENILFHAWIIPAAAVTMLLGVFILFIKGRNKIAAAQKHILVCLFILALGVIFLEMVGTQFYASVFAYKLGPVLIEEIFELSVISYTLYSISDYAYRAISHKLIKSAL